MAFGKLKEILTGQTTSPKAIPSPAEQEQVAWDTIHSQVDAFIRSKNRGQLPFNSEGQQIGHVQDRRGERASRDTAALIRIAEQQPELYDSAADNPPVIIEGQAREPDPPASERLMDLIRTKPRHRDGG